MWIRTIEEGTTYGALSDSGDIAIINDYLHQDPVDIDFHFGAVSMVTIDAQRANVAEIDTGVILFTPDSTTIVGIFACSIPQIQLPSLDGVLESSAKVITKSSQMESVIKAFSHVAAKYSCVPVTIGSKVYMSFMAKGKGWDMVVLCKAQKTTKSILDILSKGWISGTYEVEETLSWDSMPHKVKRLIAVHLGITKRKFIKANEKELVKLSATKTFKNLPLECVYEIGEILGMPVGKINGHDVLKALIERSG